MERYTTHLEKMVAHRRTEATETAPNATSLPNMTATTSTGSIPPILSPNVRR